ncbi:MAG: shikimate dehydrogenase [Clostridia bacterium]|nr:shikimate dehydrogenase [Clostridia bacterium]
MKCCVIGHPIGHSLSPFIHSELFKISGRDSSYITLDIAPEELKEKTDFLKTFDCINVTIPHKRAIMEFTDVLDPTAKQIGAVNVIKNENGTLYGYNTDGYGFSKALEAENIALKGKVLLLGYGGVALAMAHQALQKGCSLTVGTNDLTSKRAIDFCQSFKNEYHCDINMELIEKIDSDFDLIVNATPVGMYPKCDDCILKDHQIARAKAVYDAVYNPVDTTLIKKAAALKVKALSGMSMLVWQAARAHDIWYGGQFSTEQINTICKKAEEKLK